jgi:hypothetical protein
MCQSWSQKTIFVRFDEATVQSFIELLTSEIEEAQDALQTLGGSSLIVTVIDCRVTGNEVNHKFIVVGNSFEPQFDVLAFLQAIKPFVLICIVVIFELRSKVYHFLPSALSEV